MLATVAGQYRRDTGRNLFDDVLAAELADGSRIVIAGEHWAAFVPYAARWPYEVHLYPRRRVPDLPALTAAEQSEFCDIYLDLLRRFDRLFDDPRALHLGAGTRRPCAPAGRTSRCTWSCSRSAAPPGKLKYLAGSESGMGAFVNDITTRDGSGHAAGAGGGMRLLVTGGAGYIGSVVAAQLADDGHDVVVLDDLSTGHEDAVPAARRLPPRHAQRRRARPCSAPASTRCCTSRPSRWSASRSSYPARYWENNLGGTLALLEAMRATGTRRIVFSSTAAVYGEPEHIPITETAPIRPTSPYGASKVAVDTALAEYARMHQIGAVSLRYFNVAGAHADAAGTWRGERHAPETHLIPTVLAAARGRREPIRLFGDDYPTPDGTCIRDYIHVSDLARAHVLALEATAIPARTGVQPRQRDRVLQPRGARRLPGGDRPRHPGAGSAQAAGRPGGPGRLVRGHRRRTSAGRPNATCARWSPTPGPSPSTPAQAR